MTIGVIHFMSDNLLGTQMTIDVIQFMSEMLFGTQMGSGVQGHSDIMPEMLRSNQITGGVIHFCVRNA